MSTPDRSPRPSRESPALYRAAVAKATEVLQDPEVRRKVMENSRVLVDMAQRWREERRRREAPRDGPGLAERLRGRAARQFGAGRLRSRTDRLGEALDALCAQSPELAQALGEMRSDVADIGQRIPVAEVLSGRPRRKMLGAIDDRLDALEGALADALLPSAEDVG